jgi:pimeloyl-ACP methyl ester carboxylesterase
MTRERFFDAAGVALRYVDEGSGVPVVLLHCFGGNFDSQFVATGIFPALVQNHRVLGMDLRGHGGSGKPHDPRAYGAQMTRDIVRLLDHAGIERAHVVGYSMGAHLVAQLLTLAPQRAISATLGGACGRRQWSSADDVRVEAEARELEQGSMRAQILRLWPAGRPLPTDEEVEARSRRYLAGQDPLALAAMRRANHDQVVNDAALAAVHVPTLGIVGSRDPYLAQFQSLADCMRALALVVIEGATHADAAGHPQFVSALRSFLAAHA